MVLLFNNLFQLLELDFRFFAGDSIPELFQSIFFYCPRNELIHFNNLLILKFKWLVNN